MVDRFTSLRGIKASRMYLDHAQKSLGTRCLHAGHWFDSKIEAQPISYWVILWWWAKHCTAPDSSSRHSGTKRRGTKQNEKRNAKDGMQGYEWNRQDEMQMEAEGSSQAAVWHTRWEQWCGGGRVWNLEIFGGKGTSNMSSKVIWGRWGPVPCIHPGSGIANLY